MCCAIEMPRLERFLSFEVCPDFPELGWTPTRVERPRGRTGSADKEETGNDTVDVNENVVEKTMATPPESAEQGTPKKKKKWRKLPLVETGFTLSLFPRPTVPVTVDPEEEAYICNMVERQQDDYEIILSKHEQFNTNRFVTNLEATGKRTYIRADRDRKIMKAGRQVKGKHCRSLKNNDGRKKLYIHHRLFKLIDLEVNRVSSHLPSQKHTYQINFNNQSTNSSRSRLKPAPYVQRTNKPQNLAHALHRSNAPSDFDSATVNILVDIQHRELTPEDYELLLRLDERVAPKTVDKTVLSSFRTDNVTEATAGDNCAVCMDAYEIGQHRKFLPCDHVFHTKCIDMWLENSSRNCPIDGLPIDV